MYWLFYSRFRQNKYFGVLSGPDHGPDLLTRLIIIVIHSYNRNILEWSLPKLRGPQNKKVDGMDRLYFSHGQVNWPFWDLQKIFFINSGVVRTGSKVVGDYYFEGGRSQSNIFVVPVYCLKKLKPWDLGLGTAAED